jgi:hypothetical protein
MPSPADLSQLQNLIRKSDLIKMKMLMESKRIPLFVFNPVTEAPLVFLALYQAAADRSQKGYDLFEWWFNNLSKQELSSNFVDKQGNSLVMAAISTQDSILCDMILSSSFMMLIFQVNNQGLSPLHHACQMGMKRVVKVRGSKI